jgi:hypothetical protein
VPLDHLSVTFKACPLMKPLAARSLSANLRLSKFPREKLISY